MASAADIARISGMMAKYPSKSMVHRYEGRRATEQQKKYLREEQTIYPHGELISHQNQVEIEEKLSELEYSKRGTTWILVHKDDPEGFDIRSSIRTYRVSAVKALDGQLREVTALYATLATTPIQYRRQGLATALLQYITQEEMYEQTELDLSFTNDQAPEDERICFIYSKADELWSVYFETCRTALTFTVPIDHVFPQEADQSKQLHMLRKDDIPSILKRENLMLRSEVRDASQKQPNTSYFFIEPLSSAIEHRFEFGRLAMEALNLGVDADRHVYGVALYDPAQAQDVPDDEVAFMLWSAGPRDRILGIHCARASNSQQLQKLLQAAIDTCKQWDLDQGILWTCENTYEPMLKEINLGQSTFRHSPMFKMSNPADQGRQKHWWQPQHWSGAPVFFSPQ